MVDVQETPAVPPFDPKGDVRLGYFLAGGTLIALGWVFGVVLNVLFHRWAPAGGWTVAGYRIGPAFGPYAWAILLLGLATGAMGILLLELGRGSPKGPIVLPGTDE